MRLFIFILTLHVQVFNLVALVTNLQRGNYPAVFINFSSVCFLLPAIYLYFDERVG
jgi:hypothetical protein